MSNVLKDKIRQMIYARTGLFAKASIDEAELKRAIVRILNNIARDKGITISEQDRAGVINELLDEFLGLGPIERLLKDPEITEIMINGPKKIFIEKKGKTELAPFSFEDERHLMQFIYKMLSPTRRRVDQIYPYTDATLKDGSRVNIVISPVALDGPSVTIRKFLRDINTAEDLVRLGALDQRMSDFLVAAVKAKVNMIFCGATGSGKTTTLGVLCSYIGNNERIVTIEDTAELHLPQENVVRLETRTVNIEGKGEITARDLFRNSLRMRPERIILGEIRGVEALDMLQAICSGHTGSLAILHANSPQDAVYRLETMILVSGLHIALEVIQRQIVAAVNIIVHQEQLSDGSRVITHITQVCGLMRRQVLLEDIFRYDLEGIDAEGKVQGRWRATGVVPLCYHLFAEAGIELPKEIFNKD